jgi:hypothetical protein
VPELYVGNVSKQIQLFAYRSPERPGIVTQTIPIGGQICVAPNGVNVDLSPPEIDSIVNQHRMYGIVAIEDLGESNSPFNGLVYSVGKPISVEKLYKAMHRKEEELKKLGQKMRQEAALAVNSQIEEQIGAPLRQLEMSFSEEEPRGGFSDDVDHLAEGIRVTRRSQEGLPSLDQGRRGRRG